MVPARRRSVLLVLTGLLLTSVAAAQTNRSAVSVTGNDAASCTVPDPCRTFAVALSRTNPNGEVVALTSGGYGPFTINQAATIVAAPGVYAALVATSGNAITVSTSNTASVIIRGLHLYGMSTGFKGISVTNFAGEVHVENCVIDGFAIGIHGYSNTRISDTTVRTCHSSGSGIQIENASAAVRGTLDRVEVRGCQFGIVAVSNATVTVRDSVAVDCSAVGFVAEGSGQLNIENSLATNNRVGVRVTSGGTVRISNTMVTDNQINGLENVASTIVSLGNNKVRGNGLDKSGTITVVTQD